MPKPECPLPKGANPKCSNQIPLKDCRDKRREIKPGRVQVHLRAGYVAQPIAYQGEVATLVSPMIQFIVIDRR
jgi:hypothetical protein